MKSITAVLLIVMLVGLACGFMVAGARAGDDEGEEKPERVAYLGVLTRDADATLRNQLGLPRGIGLVVTYVDPAGGAAEALQKDDLLVRLNDQVLVNSEQFAVLVRTNHPGAEIRLERIRQGATEVTSVVLGGKAYKRLGAVTDWPGQGIPFPAPQIRPFSFGTFGFEGAERLREEMNEAMERIRDALGGPQMDAGREEALQQLSNVFFRARQTVPPDPQARLEAISSETSATLMENGETLTLKGLDTGRTHLTVKDEDGNVLFDGPVGTAEERARLPLQYRARLEKLKQLNTQILGSSGGTSNNPPP
jgi:hypothetical protein